MRSGQVRGIAAVLLGVLLTWVGGCASGTLGRLNEVTELPKDLSPDQQQKFAVSDQAPSGEPAPQASPTPAAGGDPAQEKKGSKRDKKKKKKKRKEEMAVDEAAAPAPLEYPSRRPSKEPIWVGEKLSFNVSYFGVSAGEFVVDSLPHKAISGREVYHIKATAVTSKVFNLFYRLNDMVESFIDFQGLFSHRFHIVLDESKQSRDALELNDSEKAQTFYWNRWNRKEGYVETKEFAAVPRFSQDSLSVLYFLRTVPLPEGAVVTVPVVSEGKSWEAVVTVMKREQMSTPLGKVMTVMLKPETRFQGVLKKQGDSFLWLTDDDRRVPVRLEAKVKIGTVVANLEAFEPGTPPPAQTAPASVPAGAGP